MVASLLALFAAHGAMARSPTAALIPSPSSPPAPLTTHRATTTTPNSFGELAVTARCALGEHVVSGGYNSSLGSAAVASHAAGNDGWTVELFPGSTDKLTAYAYCARAGRIVTHRKRGTAMAAPANTAVAARCTSSEALVAGGYEYASAPSDQEDSPTYRDYATTRHTWAVMAAIRKAPAQLVVFAYCERGVSVTVRSRTSPSIPAHSGGSATASCHHGETLLGGGYSTTPLPDWNNAIGPDLFFSATFRSGVRSWTARAHNFSSANSMTSGAITAFAYCERG